MVKLTQRSCNLKVVGRARIWTSVWYQLLFSFCSLASNTQSQPIWLHCRCQSHVMGSLLLLSTLPWGRGHSWTCLQVQFSRSVLSDSLRPHGLQHTRPPCPSPIPRVYSNSCPLSRWYHPIISFSVILFSFCLQSFPASGFFQWVSSSHQMAKVLEFQLQHQSFQWISRTDFL